VIESDIEVSEDLVRDVLREQHPVAGDPASDLKPTGAGWQLYAGAVHYLGWGLFAGLLVWAFICLLAAVVGASGYVSFIDWWQLRMVRGR
jgi:hypothetical protein